MTVSQVPTPEAWNWKKPWETPERKWLVWCVQADATSWPLEVLVLVRFKAEQVLS